MFVRRVVVAVLAAEGSDRLTGRDQNTVDLGELSKRPLEEEAFNRKDTDRESLPKYALRRIP